VVANSLPSAFLEIPKATVLGMVEREGEVRAMVIPFSGAGDIRPRVFDNVKAGSVLFTDGYPIYRTMANVYDHAWVDHTKDEYVRGAAHTQTIEGFWSIMKGGLNGVYRGAVSKKWLQSYVDEYAFHYNGHRPHRALAQLAPLNLESPPLISDPEPAQLQRRGAAFGLIHEYRLVA